MPANVDARPIGQVTGAVSRASVLPHFVQQFERVAGFAVHLVDEGEDGDVPHPADLEQFPRPSLDTFCGVDHHHRGIDGGQGAIGVFGEILVARRIQQVEHAAAVLERHHGGDDGNAALPLDTHPVGPGPAALAFGAHVAGQLDRAARAQQAFGESGLASVGVRDDREGATAGDFFGWGHNCLRMRRGTLGPA